MNFTLMPLPYEADALDPFISARTVKIHHQRHHAGYLKKLDLALEGAHRDKSLTDIVLGAEGDLYNLAGQVWNHDFYWQSLAPSTQPVPETIAGLLEASFGGQAEFNDRFADVAAGTFGSGWAWLVFDPDEHGLAIESTSNAGNPLKAGSLPLLTLDVWEHAYYLDYQQDRGAYINDFLQAHVNWAFADENLVAALQRSPT